MEEHLRKTYMVVVRPDEGLSSPGDSSDDVEWKVVRALIDDFAKVHPKEVRELMQENEVIRQSTHNQFGSSDDGFRWGLRMPPGLVRAIDRRFPKFMVTKRNVHRLMEAYPAYRVCETV